MIRAAGAVLWRAGEDGPRLAVIHRPKYDDWTLPKGKLESGEDFLTAALREVAEETGHGARPGAALGETRYQVTKGGAPQEKVVRYWAMESLGGEFTPGTEVDELRWLSASEVLALLSYDHDREVVQRFLAED